MNMNFANFYNLKMVTFVFYYQPLISIIKNLKLSCILIKNKHGRKKNGKSKFIDQ